MFDKKGVFWFLGLNFGLRWLLDLAIYLRGGLAAPGWANVVALQMLMPAFSAILLGLFFLPESPIYHRRPAGRERWFYYFFLLYTVIFTPIALGALLAPANATISLAATYAIMLLSILGLLALVVLRFAAGRQAMVRVWLAWGNWRYWLLLGLAFVAFYALQVVLNAIFGLGPIHLAPIPAPPGFNPNTFTILKAVGAVLLGSVLSIVLAFGEEYGWRGYLQGELFKLGRVRGVLLLGVIWGAWHWPIILMGFNYPGHPLLGLVLMTLHTTCSGVVLSYAVLKSGSVLLAAFLHAIPNVATENIMAIGFTPFDSAFSFGIGIYGIAMLAIIALLVLRDPIWRGKGSSLALPEPAPVARALSENPGAIKKGARKNGHSQFSGD